MTIDERLEALVVTAELRKKQLQADAEHIRALARIAKIPERRLESLEGNQS